MKLLFWVRQVEVSKLGVRDGDEWENKCKGPETKRTLYVQGRGERSARLELGELCGEWMETRETAKIQIIRKPWKHFEERNDVRQMQKSAKNSALPAGLLEPGQVIIYLKSRKESSAGLSFLKDLSWMLTDLALSFVLPQGLHGYRKQNNRNSIGSFYSRTSQRGTRIKRKYYWHNQ